LLGRDVQVLEILLHLQYVPGLISLRTREFEQTLPPFLGLFVLELNEIGLGQYMKEGTDRAGKRDQQLTAGT
jgi:hypothetical protein